MSRSYRKHPFFKCAGDTRNKKLFNRRIRRSNKLKDIPNGGAYRKYNPTWDLYDFRMNCTWPKFREWNWVREKYYDSEEEAFNHWKKYYRSK